MRRCLRLTFHHFGDGTCQLEKDAGADSRRGKAWTPGVPPGADNQVSVYNTRGDITS